MTKQSTRSQDELQPQQTEADASDTPAVTPSSPEAEVAVVLLDNTLIGRHWHPRGHTLTLTAAQARTLEAVGKALIQGI